MIYYLDTSVLIASHTAEIRTKDIQTWLERQKSETLAISEWVITEFSAALSKKQRVGEIDTAYRALVLAEFQRITLPALTLLEIRSAEFRLAARFADQSLRGLRAGDALRLAITCSHDAALYTLDERLATAAPDLGAKAVLL